MKRSLPLGALLLLAGCGGQIRVDDFPLAGVWLRGTKTEVVISRSSVLFVTANGSTNTGRLETGGDGSVRIVENAPSAQYLANFFPPAAAATIATNSHAFEASYAVLAASPTNLTLEAHIRRIECDADGTLYENEPLTRTENWVRKP